jgi:tetratricopeptide (TPR) repeat protein
MRQARSLDDAERILRAQRPIGCWTYLITDGPRGEVLCWEENPERQVVAHKSRDGGTFGYANIYLDRELGDTERNLYPSYWRHNLGRHQRVNQLLHDDLGQHDAQAMSRILADQGDSSCRISAAIGMVMTVGSVVFKPEDGLLWVGAGQAPTSQRQMLAFDLNGERHAPEHGALDGGVDTDPTSRQAYAAYRDAYVAFMDDGDLDAARRHVRHACKLQPEQPLFQCLDGLLALRGGDASDAFDAFGRALSLGHPHPERIATFHLWRGRAADVRGEREQALRDYRAALGHHADPNVIRAARRGLKKRYPKGDARRIDVDMTYVDVINP